MGLNDTRAIRNRFLFQISFTKSIAEFKSFPIISSFIIHHTSYTVYNTTTSSYIKTTNPFYNIHSFHLPLTNFESIMFHNANIPSFDRPHSSSIQHLNHSNFTIPNDENEIQRHHQTKKLSSRSSSSSKKGLAFKPIHQNTQNHQNHQNVENGNVLKQKALFPKTPSSFTTKNSNQKKERRRALGDISNRKASSNRNKHNSVGFHDTLKNSSTTSGSVSGGTLKPSTVKTTKSLSTKKSNKKKKSILPKKSVTFDQQIYRDDIVPYNDYNNDAETSMLKSRNHRGLHESSTALKSQTKSVQRNSNISKMNHVEVEDIEVSAGRTW